MMTAHGATEAAIADQEFGDDLYYRLSGFTLRLHPLHERPEDIPDLEPELYRRAIRLAGDNQAQAARWLGVTRLKMREKLTALGLHPATRQDPAPPATPT
jgi:DNA-binding NtrC family response regulator